MEVVELYGRVSYAVKIEGLSRREAARQFGIDPRIVSACEVRPNRDLPLVSVRTLIPLAEYVRARLSALGERFDETSGHTADPATSRLGPSWPNSTPDAIRSGIARYSCCR